MGKLVRNAWARVAGTPVERAAILSRDVEPEGLDAERVRFVEPGSLQLDDGAGHLVGAARGRATLKACGESLALRPGVHCYVPPGAGARIESGPGTDVVHVSAPAERAPRRELIVRDEAFLAACSVGRQSLRWILTPQYLSRRIFLHHDGVLLSKEGHPVSWFHTTMFDVAGLPPNEEGEPVFKMQYNSRTEFNICYDVEGDARVRMAVHPYSPSPRGQSWSDWRTLDGESTYHLDEDDQGGLRTVRNKHEVFVSGGHVTLFCLFDPAPTGVERHRPGDYSDYEPLSQVMSTPEYESHRRSIGELDEMIDSLSLAKARGELEPLRETPLWALYTEGCLAQRRIEADLQASLARELKGRDRLIARWMFTTS